MKAYNIDITIEEFIARYAEPYDPNTDNYFREPFARDTKVGKNSAIYNAHSYHTKVPPEGIVPYILHYTQPGDLVLDPFCGSGMTGVAAMMCARPPKGAIVPAGSKLGARKAILNDLSPAACHIAYNYTHPVDAQALKAAFNQIMQELQTEFDWLYGTTCSKCKGPATIQYTIWSDIFECFRCNTHFALWDVAVDTESNKVRENFHCPNPQCSVVGRKDQHKLIDSQPVTMSYQCERCRPSRSDRPISGEDIAHLEIIKNTPIPHWVPADPLDLGREMLRHGGLKAGVKTIGDFYTHRNLYALSLVWHRINKASPELMSTLHFAFTAILGVASRRNRWPQFATLGTGTLYVGSISIEMNVPSQLKRRIRAIEALNNILNSTRAGGNIFIQQGSARALAIKENSIDYIFTDPPFGSNIFYADGSLTWESWLGEVTNEEEEIVVNDRRQNGPFKTVNDYGKLMARAFAEMHRLLKPGRWASVVFSNSDDRVWQVIREGAAAAGFDLANTVALDKKQRSFKQIKGEKGEENVVGTDVIMNLHKKARVMVQVADVSDLDAVVLSFIRQHLEELPAQIKADPRTYSDALRATDALYTVALQELMNNRLSHRGLTMPYVDELCAAAFKKVAGRWYLPSEEIYSDSLLAEIQDEPSAIAWIRRRLEKRPLTFAELVPEWRQETFKIGDALGKSLRQILEENFWHESETNRWRIPTEAEKARMGDERTLRLKRKLRQLVEGKDETPASDQELLELMTFAYQEISDPRAIVAIYRRLNASSLAETDRRRASRMYQAALAQTQEDYGTEWEDRQQRLI